MDSLGLQKIIEKYRLIDKLRDFSRSANLPLFFIGPRGRLLYKLDWRDENLPCRFRCLRELPSLLAEAKMSNELLSFPCFEGMQKLVYPLTIDSRFFGALIFCQIGEGREVANFIGRGVVDLIHHELELKGKENEINYREEELSLLHRISDILSNVFDIKEACRRVLEEAAKVLKAERCSIMLRDKEKRDELRIMAAYGLEEEIIENTRVKIGDGVSGKVVKEGAPLLVKDKERRGRYKTGSFICVPLIYKEEEVSSVIGVINVTDRISGESFSEADLKLLSILAKEATLAIKNAEYYQILMEEKEEIDAILSNMMDGVIMVDSSYNAVVVNQSLCRMLERGKEEILGRRLEDLLKDFNLSIPLPELKKIEECSFSFEAQRKKGKPLFLSIKGTKIFDKEGNVVNIVFVMRDITEEEQEEKLKRSFLSLVSHKLKTPLSVILGQTYFALESFKELDEEVVNVLRIVGKQGKNLRDLIEKLLAFTIIEGKELELKREKVSVNTLISEGQAKMRNLIREENVEVVVELPPNLPQLFVDKDKVVEVFRNLIENAIKFNDKNFKIVKIMAKRFDDSLLIQVEDNGLGIPEGEREKVFRKFYQVEEFFTGEVEGIGLGLPLVKRIVEEHGGEVWIERGMEGGSRVSFTLPITKES